MDRDMISVSYGVVVPGSPSPASKISISSYCAIALRSDTGTSASVHELIPEALPSKDRGKQIRKLSLPYPAA